MYKSNFKSLFGLAGKPMIELKSKFEKTVTTKVPSLDLNLYRSCIWKLEFTTKYTFYLIIYIKLEYGKEILLKLVKGLEKYIDYSLQLDKHALLIHVAETDHYRILKTLPPIFGAYSVYATRSRFLSIHQNTFLQYLREFRLQLIKYNPSGRIGMTIYGISVSNTRRKLLKFFIKLGQLISYKFERYSKYYIIRLQYANYSNHLKIIKQIKRKFLTFY